MAAQFLGVQPVLPSRDVGAAMTFYVERLGFLVLFADDATAPRYAAVQRGAVQLHLQWHDPAEWGEGDRPMVRIVVDDPVALHAEYQDKDVFHARTAVRRTPWRTEEFAFYDLDRNGLTFYRDL